MSENKTEARVVIKLTAEQKRLIKEKTGKDIEEIELDEKLELKRISGVNSYD